MRSNHVTICILFLIVSLFPVSWTGCTRESYYDKIDRWKSEANVKQLTDVLEGRAPPRNMFMWEYREKAARALGEIGDSRSVEPLISALKREGPEVRQAIVEALVKIGEPAVEPLIDALSHENSNIRKDAVQALGAIKDPRAAEALITIVLEDKDAHVQQAAAHALEEMEIRDERTIQALAVSLRNSSLSQYSEKALIKIGKPAVGPLIAQLDLEVAKKSSAFSRGTKDSQTPDVWFMRNLIYVLAKIGDNRATDSTITAMEDGSVRPSTEVVSFLGSKLSDSRVPPLLIRWLDCADLDVAEEAARWLGIRQEAEAIKPLLDKLRKIAPELSKYLQTNVKWEHSSIVLGESSEKEEFFYTSRSGGDIQEAVKLSRLVKTITCALANFEKNTKTVVPELIDTFPVIVEPVIGYGVMSGNVVSGYVTIFPRNTFVPPDRQVPCYTKVYIGAEALRRLTGADVGDEQELWRQWWQESKYKYLP